MWPLWFQILGWLLTVIIIIGNGLVIYLITTRRKLRSTTNWFVLSLAVADFGFGTTFFVRFYVGQISQICTNHVIVIAYSIGNFFIYASAINLCALTLDRYFAIVKPFTYITFMTAKHIALLISTAWTLPFLVVLILCVTIFLATEGKTCDTIDRYFAVFLTVLNFNLCVFLLCATARIFLIARRHVRKNAALIAQLSFNHRIQHGRVFKPQEAAATKMVGVVVGVFVSCYLLDIYHTVCDLAGSCKDNEALSVVVVLLLLVNSAINPVVYAFFKREIRKELKRLFCYGRQDL